MAVLLIAHGLVWSVFDPFGNFSRETLERIGAPESFNVEGAVKQLQSWSCLGTATTLLQGVFAIMLIFAATDKSCNCLAILQSLKEEWPRVRIYICVVVFLTQVALLVGLPIGVGVGKILACKAIGSDDSQHCALEAASTAELLLHVTAVTPDMGRAIAYQSTIVNMLFTGIFTTYLGIYFVVLLLAAALGMFVGTVAFSWQDGHRNHVEISGRSGAGEMAFSFTVLTDFVIGATVLGPFMVVYQTLGSSSMGWAMLIGPSICRPAGLLLLRKFVKERSLQAKALACWGAVGTLGSCAAAVGLWVQVKEALAALNGLQVSGPFACSTFCSIAVCMAVASLTAFENQARGQQHGKPAKQAASAVTAWLDSWGLFTAINACEGSAVIQRLAPKIILWVEWLLSMDALVTLYYHLLKTCYLAWCTNFIYNCSVGARALWIATYSRTELVRFLDENIKEMTPEEHLQIGWSVFVPISILCAFMAWATSKVWYRQRHTFRVVSTNSQSETERLEGEAEPRHQVVRRLEFLLVGLGHWLLVFARKKISRQADPHNFEFLLFRFKDKANNQRTLEWFHAMLKERYHLTMPTRDITILDKAYLALDDCFFWRLSIEGFALLLGCLAAVLHVMGCMAWSKGSVFLLGALVALAALLPLLPNYMDELKLAPYYEGCGTNFDAYVKAVIQIAGGTACSAVLGTVVFGSLLSLPISLVRGLWLLLLPPDVDSTEAAAEQPLLLSEDGSTGEVPANTGSEDGSTRDRPGNTGMLNVLCHLMKLLACLIPIVGLFPLLFAVQLTEDEEAKKVLLAFWLCPQAWIVARPGSTGPASPYRRLSFYPIWLCTYGLLFAWFLQKQFHFLRLDFMEYIINLDWPLAWSWMHAEFCIMNVLVTDVLDFVLHL